MKKYFNVSFQYSESVYCANIAHAESAEAVEAHYSAKYEWCKVSEATAADVEEAQRKGKPIVEIETPKKPKATQKKHESKTAWSTAHAWAIVDELFPGDYAKDEQSSERAGYPIYRATSEDSCAYICDLGDGLEINYDDGSTCCICINATALEAERQQAEQVDNLRDRLAWYQGELDRETRQRKAAEEAARKADEARALSQGELEDAREALADKDAECDDLAQSVENALQHAEDMEAEAEKLAAEVLRLKARLFDLMEAQQGRTA